MRAIRDGRLTVAQVLNWLSGLPEPAVQRRKGSRVPGQAVPPSAHQRAALGLLGVVWSKPRPILNVRAASMSAFGGRPDVTGTWSESLLVAKTRHSLRHQQAPLPSVSVSFRRLVGHVHAGLAEAVDNMVDQVIGEVPTSAIVAHPCRVVAGAMLTAAGTTARVR